MENIIRDSFVFYRSFYEAFLDLNAEEIQAFVLAICEYALNGKEPVIKDRVVQIAWKLVKPQLDANKRKYENGKLGGAPKGSHNNPNGRRGKSEPEQVDPESRPVVSDSIPPSIEDVREFFQEYNIPNQAEDFYRYNESRGWMVGNTPVASWKALAKSWISKAREKNPNIGDPKLGVGEFRTPDGRRTYGPGDTIVPESADPRPSNASWGNVVTNEWDTAA